MKERLLGFLFCGVFVAYAVNLAADQIHARLFADSLWFQARWYVPFLIVPGACLLVLAWSFGFFRPEGPRWADAAALAATALLLYLTVGADYSCWHYCF
ncbi:MAG TPA: hypothetical protein VLL04_02070 [Rhizomicrobium sp.]|nr:hypothetical protein [Rhizomicrobium sp.]